MQLNVQKNKQICIKQGGCFLAINFGCTQWPLSWDDHFSPFSFGHWELLHYDNIPRTNRLPELLGRAPRTIGAAVFVPDIHIFADRRDHFETSKDVWELMRTVVRERKSREFDPTVGVLKECMADPDYITEDKDTRKRIEDTYGLMVAMSSWGEEMLRMEPATLMKVMKLGSKIQKLMRENTK